MAQLEADTHSMIVTGAGPTAADTDAIISGAAITFPAGGPWKVFQVFGQGVLATATAAEKQGSHFRLNAPSGDVTPNPAPSRFPIPSIGSFLGAVHDVPACPLVLHDVDYTVQGKGTLEFIVQESTAVTVAAQYVCGIIFGKTRPVHKPFVYVDRASAQVSAAADSSVATLTLAERATKITAVCGMLTQDGVLTTAEELTGFFRLASDDVKLPPMQLPFSTVFGAGLGATIANATYNRPIWIPVNIPIEGGARIDCFVDLNTAVTNPADVEIFIAYE